MKKSNTTAQHQLAKANKWFLENIQQGIRRLNNVFNQLSSAAQKIMLITSGLGLASCCLWLIFFGLTDSPQPHWNLGSITKPQPMETKPDTVTLIPLGKMKGEIMGEFEAFYVAMDRKGNFYINHNPTYTKERWNRSPAWKPISYSEFKEYEKILRFIPMQDKSLTP